jgi:hypothetical protein
MALGPTPELDPRFSEPDATPTAWDAARAALAAAELFWISTVRSTGRPHVAPPGGVTDETHLRALAAAWEEKYDGDWGFEVRDGAFHHGGGTAHVFEVAPRRVLAFAKGEFAQTRFRFDGG